MLNNNKITSGFDNVGREWGCSLLSEAGHLDVSALPLIASYIPALCRTLSQHADKSEFNSPHKKIAPCIHYSRATFHTYSIFLEPVSGLPAYDNIGITPLLQSIMQIPSMQFFATIHDSETYHNILSNKSQ